MTAARTVATPSAERRGAAACVLRGRWSCPLYLLDDGRPADDINVDAEPAAIARLAPVQHGDGRPRRARRRRQPVHRPHADDGRLMSDRPPRLVAPRGARYLLTDDATYSPGASTVDGRARHAWRRCSCCTASWAAACRPTGRSAAPLVFALGHGDAGRSRRSALAPRPGQLAARSSLLALADGRALRRRAWRSRLGVARAAGRRRSCPPRASALVAARRRRWRRRGRRSCRPALVALATRRRVQRLGLRCHRSISGGVRLALPRQHHRTRARSTTSRNVVDDGGVARRTGCCSGARSIARAPRRHVATPGRRRRSWARRGGRGRARATCSCTCA